MKEVAVVDPEGDADTSNDLIMLEGDLSTEFRV